MIHIERSTTKDIPAIISVALQSYLKNYTHLWHDNGVWYMQRCFNNDRLAEEFADKNAAFFLIYRHEEAVGFIKLNVDKAAHASDASNSLELERLYLLDKVTGEGIGGQAMQFVTQFAKSKNKKLIWLKAMDKSNALKFYQRQGFRIFEEDYLSFPCIKDEFKKIVSLFKEI
jgi:diamine N-acetyltransferase